MTDKQPNKQKTEEEPVEILLGLPEKDLLRIHEVAHYFSCSNGTVRNWIDHGLLKTEQKRGMVWVRRSSIIEFRQSLQKNV